MIDGKILGDDKAIAALLSIPRAAESEMRATVGRNALKLQRLVMAGKLSGQVLKVRTGNLRRSIDSEIFEQSGAVIGKVSTNVKYARVHEYGFHGTVTVKGHMRKVKQAWGKRLATPVVANVKAHSRNVNLPERSFLRSALADMRAAFIADVYATAQKFAGGAK